MTETLTTTPAPAETPPAPDAQAGTHAGQRAEATRGPDARGAVVVGPPVPGADEVLTPEALALVTRLHREFEPRRRALLARRRDRAARIAAGEELTFRANTAHIRAGDWRVAPPAPGLARRHVEITGPVSRHMAINALNSGADVWMADFEDATTPSWARLVEGQRTLQHLVAGSLDFTTDAGKDYRVTAERTPTVVVRPRGWHLPERNVTVDGEPVSGSLVDVALYATHCAHAMIARGQGPYFYLPKLESAHEARLWNDVFVRVQEQLGIPRGTIRATVLIETIWAAFEMDEILFALREHSSGLNAGRWDYIFSVIKTFRDRPDFVLPDRADVTMRTPFMRAYTELLVATCHRRGAHAIGGMAAFVPNRRDPEATAAALARVRSDKDRDADDGFDGSWVAHPDLVATCREAFDAVLADRDDQRERLREDVRVGPADLLSVPATPGEATLAGLRANIAVSLRYLRAWLAGSGAVAIGGLMEDAATVEISRSQVWQWVRHRTRLAEGFEVTPDLAARVLAEESDRLRTEVGPSDAGSVDAAADLFAEVALATDFPDFVTLPAYTRYLSPEAAS